MVGVVEESPRGDESRVSEAEGEDRAGDCGFRGAAGKCSFHFISQAWLHFEGV